VLTDLGRWECLRKESCLSGTAWTKYQECGQRGGLLLPVNEEVEEDWEEDCDESGDNDGGKIGPKASGQPTIVVVPRHDFEWQ